MTLRSSHRSIRDGHSQRTLCLCSRVNISQDTTTRIVMASTLVEKYKKEPPNIQLFLEKQSAYSVCQAEPRSVWQSLSEYSIDQHELLVRRPLVESSIQTVESKSLQKSALPLALPTSCRKKGQRGLYNSYRRDLYWPHEASFVYDTVDACEGFARSNQR